LPYSNKEKKTDYQKSYYATHRQEFKDYRNAYYNAHQDELRAKARQYWAIHKKERLANNKVWQTNNREKYLAQKRRYSANHKKKNKDRHLRALYNITLDQAMIMLRDQDYCCAICGKHLEPDEAYIDHDHVNHRVRGILCNSCNLGLGKFHESITILRQAANYLEQSQKVIEAKWLSFH
jgi:hypothetical protein